MRVCGECTMCCHYLNIPEVPSPPRETCKHCDKGCTIYETRPQSCRGFSCLWLAEPQIPDRLRPDICGMFFEKPGEKVYIGHGPTPSLELIQKINEAGFSVIVGKNIYARHSPEEVFDDLRQAYNRIYNDSGISNHGSGSHSECE